MLGTGIGIGIGPFGGGNSLTQRLSSLFPSGRNGALYDPSDMASLYQDSAGTTPVTAVTNPVGKASDKSGNTNHAIQATAAARPTWTNRGNLLTYTEQFDNAAWVKTGGTISANAITAPNGTLTGDKLVENTATLIHAVEMMLTFTGGSNTLSVYAKAAERTWLHINLYPMANGRAWFNLANGTLGTVDAAATATITSVGDGWYRCSVTRVTNAQTYCDIYAATSDGVVTYEGDGVSGIYLWGAQLEQGSTATTYQRVTTATNFDTVGFPYYLSFLGTDDSLSSATGGGGSAGFFWCGVVQPTGGAGTLQTLFADNGTNTGYKVQKDVNNKLSFSAGNNAAFTTKVSTATISIGTKVILTVWDDGTNLNVQVGDAAAETVARPVVVAGTAGYTIAKDNGAASSFYIGNIYASVYFRDTAGTATDREIAQDYCRLMGGM